MRPADFIGSDRVGVRVTGFGDGICNAEIMLTEDHIERVDFPYSETMTVSQMQVAALRQLKAKLEKTLARLGSEISDREARRA